MPRIAAAFAWLGVIAVALAMNISRYPLVTQMVQNAYRAETADSSPSPGGTGVSPVLPLHTGETPVPPASPDKSAIALRTAEHESPSTVSGEESVAPAGSPVSFSPPMAPIEDADAAAQPVNAADPFDLGNGVRRLPPVE